MLRKLEVLPDISKWNVSNVTNMSYLFYECESLAFIPDISKWITNDKLDTSYMFSDCFSLSLINCIKWIKPSIHVYRNSLNAIISKNKSY